MLFIVGSNFLNKPTLLIEKNMVEHQYEGKDSAGLVIVEIAMGISTVPQWSFAIVPTLEEVRLASSVKSLDDNAFFSCKKLAKINLNDVETIGENCFKFSALEEVNLGKVKNIKEFAFSNCSYLRAIKFSDDLKTIGDFAFNGDSAIISCYIPSGEIGTSAFMGCTKLEQIKFGKVISIGNAAFLNCNSLVSLVIPSTVKVIGNEAFAGCENLKNVMISSRDTNIAGDAFDKDVVITYKK